MSSTVIEPVLVMLEPTNRGELDATRNDLLATRLPDAITSPQEYAAIAADQERVDRFIKRAKPEFDDVCDSAHKAWKKACNLRALFFDGLEAFNARARRLMGDYRATEDRLRREEERRISEEQRRQEQERINREAKLLEKQGQKEMAAAVRQTPVSAPAVSLPSIVPVVQGLTYSTPGSGASRAARARTGAGRTRTRASGRRRWCRGSSSTSTTRRLPRASRT
jgi:hypothetical protein